MFGKYIDAYQHAALTGYVPPGWDRWAAFVRSRYLDYKLTIDGHIQAYGDDASDYSTNVLGSLAERFIRDTPGPIFVEYAPAAPHAPAISEARFQGAFADLPPWRPPSYDEPDVSDKPSYIRDLPPLSGDVRAAVDAFRQNQYRTLQSVDSQVEALVGALRDTGRLSDTLIVFTSDNGISWGEHRWVKKEVPYEESIRVPLVVRYDPMTAADAGATSPALALNIDIAPTIAAVAGVPASHRRTEPAAGPRRPSGGVADAIPDRAHGGLEPGPDVLRGAHGSLPLRSIRDGRAGALRPASGSVRTDQRGEREPDALGRTTG